MIVRHSSDHKTEADALAARERFLQDYPRAGYGTYATVHKVKDDHWVMSAHRDDSCD